MALIGALVLLLIKFSAVFSASLVGANIFLSVSPFILLLRMVLIMLKFLK